MQQPALSGIGMVVAPQPEVAEVGVEVLRAGGNAVDAALACAFLQTAIDPMMCGIAGFGSLIVYLPKAKNVVHECIDFHAPAPLAVTPAMWEDLIEGEARDGFGFRLRGRANDLGYQSICVPAALRGFHEAHQLYGSLPWGDLIEPAIRTSMDGWFVRPAVYAFWNAAGEMGRVDNTARLGFSESGRKLFCRSDGSPKRTGEWIHNPDYARTLAAIAKHGVDIFYSGEIGALIAEDMAAHGGFLSARDLSAYRAQRNQPLQSTYRGYRVSTNTPPGGGVMLLEMLNILENFDLRVLRHNSADYIVTLAETMKRATVDKDQYVGDTRFLEIPLGRLTSKDYAREVAAAITSGHKVTVTRFECPQSPPDTTHVSVVDSQGGCASLTHSLGMPSGVITSGLGFFYNGSMGAFDPRPNRAASIAPGKTRFSGICPSIVFKEKDPFLVIGAPGGTQIPMGMLQAIVNVIDFDLTMQEAVSAPRFSATSNVIDVVNRIPRAVGRALEARGYEVVRNPFGYSIAWVHGIKRSNGHLEGGADPGRDGMALATDFY
jgi:gamma-glutamyltranspeptidase / glutathione hydrolase